MYSHLLPSSQLPSLTDSAHSHSTTRLRLWLRQLFLVIFMVSMGAYALLDLRAQESVPSILAHSGVVGPQATYNKLQHIFPLDRHIRFIAEDYRHTFNEIVAARQHGVPK